MKSCQLLLTIFISIKILKKFKITILKQITEKGAAGAVIKRKDLPVETSAEKLVKFCCGLNILKTGEEVPLKSNSEYPEWLWKLKLDGAPKPEEMDPNTLQYWKRKRRIANTYKIKMMKSRFPEPFVPLSVRNMRPA